MPGGAAGKFHGGRIRIVRRVKYDDFIAWMNDCLYGAEKPLGSAIADSDFELRIDVATVKGGNFFGDRLPQRRYAGHWRVLVCAGVQVVTE